MAFLDMFDKLDDIIYKPVEMICDWAKEPIRRFQDKRDAAAEQRTANIEADRQKLEMELEVAKQEKLSKLQVDQRKWNAEVDNWIDEKDIERNTKILDAMTQYRRIMTNDMKEIADAITKMKAGLLIHVNNLIKSGLEDLKETRESMIETRNKELIKTKELFDNGIIDEKRWEKAQDEAFEFSKKFSDKCIEAIDQLKSNVIEIAESAKITMENYDHLLDELFRTWGKTLGISCDNNAIPLQDNKQAIPKLQDNS